MTLPIFQLVQVIKDTIVHRGAKGCIYRLLLEDVGATPPLGYFIAQRYIAGCGFHFRIGEKYLDICGQSFDNFVAYYHEIVCYACETEIDHLCGIVDPGVILEEEKHLQLALETVAASETIGCLISEITRSDGASQTHASVDKLVGLGYLVKQSINPVAKSTKCRTESKSVVLHNKLYASDYDEAADGVKIIVGNNYLDKVHDLIIEVLEKRNVRSLSARELSKCLGISRWDMQALRNATIALDRKDGARVCFFQATCHVTYDSGVLGPETRMWCVGRAADRAELDAAGSGQRPFLCSRNVPVHQAIVTVLNNGGQYRAGVTSSDIRSITGASYKRAAKLFTEFHKSFGYPLEKVQEGKQLKYRVLPKQRSESSPPSVAAIKAEGGGEVAEAEEESMHIQQPAELPSSSAATLLFSDQQRLNCDTIENFLREVGLLRDTIDGFTSILTPSPHNLDPCIICSAAGWLVLKKSFQRCELKAGGDSGPRLGSRLRVEVRCRLRRRWGPCTAPRWTAAPSLAPWACWNTRCRECFLARCPLPRQRPQPPLVAELYLLGSPTVHL